MRNPKQLHRLSLISLFIIILILPSIYALSTVSISETFGSVIICALLGWPYQNSSSLSCTTFPDGSRNSPSTVPFSATVAGDGFVCGLRSSSSTAVLGCWRFSAGTTHYKRIYRGPPLRDLASGNTHICGIIDDDTSHRLQCWQWRDFNFNAAVLENLSTVTIGDDFLCGLSADGTVICSGNHLIDENKPPGSGYRLVEAGPSYACAVSINGSLNCWGGDAVIDNAPEGEFTSLALGQKRSCGIRANQTVTCWGDNNFTLPAKLVKEYFLDIEAKRSVFCGVLASNASLYCWGGQVNGIVFDNVVPGSCRSSCPCGHLPLSAGFCGQGYYICLLSCPPQPPLLEAPPPSPPPSGWNDKKADAFLIVGSIGSGCFLLLVSFLLFRYCKGKVCRIHDSGRLDSQPNSNSNPNSNRNQSIGAAPVLEKRLSHLVSMGQNVEEFSLQRLREATNGFSEELKIGSGSFGSVYRAKLEDGQEIAIKRAELVTLNVGAAAAKRQLEDKDHAFVKELESLSRLHHKNLVRLLGFCEDRNELILVYEFMSNGTLHDHLHHRLINNHSPLMSWTARIKVALDAARGMEYLHVYASPPVIHRDIKSSNILLDSNWVAKVSDFGLSLKGPEDEASHLSLHAAGTLGYVDPEYYRLQQLTLKSDVYSFGVVLLELLSGYRAIHKNENEVARNVVDVVVPYIIHHQIHRVLDAKMPPPNPFELEAVKYVGYLAADCVSLQGRDRPSSTEIVDSLGRALIACSAQHGRSSSLNRNNYSTNHVHVSFLKAMQSWKSI